MNERELASRMRADWDRRIAHDYRFWMSDGYQSDQVMWETGERDFNIITRDIEDTSDKTILEIGCGVGRLLKSAIDHYQKVIGLDISSVALERATSLVGSHSHLELVAGDGYSLSQISSQSVDVVYSFAAITSTPLEIFSRYLLEANRVLKDGGLVRLQIYLGKEQRVTSDDTLHLRCFDEENFRKAIAAAGFTVEWIDELKLPFEVSFEEAGIFAKIGSFRKISEPTSDYTQVGKLLLPDGEPQTADAITGLEVECWMSLNYARELAECGDVERARETLNFAVAHAKSINLDIQDLLDRIVGMIEALEAKKKQVLTPEPDNNNDSDIFQRNIAIIQKRFPEAYRQITSFGDSSSQSVEVRDTEEGIVLVENGQVLDHPTAPVRAAVNWTKAQLQVPEVRDADNLFVFGFAGGHHLETLLEKRPEAKLTAIEPSLAVLRATLSSRDCAPLLERLEGLLLGAESVDFSCDGKSEILLRPQTANLYPEQASQTKTSFFKSKGIGLLSPNISVLGPMMGGTLPILGYTVHALSQLHQRVRSIDMSPFATGFNGISDLVFDDMRQRLLRGKFSENLSDMVSEIANEKPMDILICMAQAPITVKTLEELRSRGVITVLWFVEDYLRFPAWKFLAKHYDFVFTIQRGECIEAIKAAGAGEVHYLPTAADPAVHLPLQLSAEERERWGSPVSFVGAGYHNRQQMFASLSGLPIKLWGTEWPECKPFDRMVQEEGRRLKPQEYVKIFNSTSINLNLHSSTERDGVDPAGDFINPRTFELAACGAFQLVDKRSLLSEVFTPGEEVETFESRKELIEKIEYYLAHPEARQPFIEKARARVLREHTYQHRITEMLSIIYSSRYSQLRKRIGESPWKRVIERAEPHPELKERCEIAYRRGEDANLDGLVADIVTGEGNLTETEQKLLFLFHIRKQMIRMKEHGRVKS